MHRARVAAAAVIALALAARASAAPSDVSSPSLPTIDSTHPAAIRFTGDHVTRADLDVRSAPEVSWLRVELAPGGRTDVDLELPAGTRVVGIGERDREDSREIWGAPTTNADAQQQLAHASGEPSIVDYRGDSAGVLHAHLTGPGAATIDLALELPALASITIDGARDASIAIAGARRREPTVSLAGITALPADRDDSYAHLDANTALMAIGAGARSVPVVILSGRPTSSQCFFNSYPDKKSIRAVVHGREGALMHCYQLEAQRDASLRDRDITLHFRIDGDGTIGYAEVDNAPQETRDCMVAEITTWQFLSGGTPTDVNYPLMLRLYETTDD